MSFPSTTHRAWAEVDLSRLAHNLKEIRRRIGSRVEVIAVVKANAYGHGAVPVSQELQRLGVKTFAVASPQEAIELREGGITGKVLVLGCTFPFDAEAIIESKATVALSDPIIAAVFSKAAQWAETRIPVHLKVDTGMGRLGVHSEEAVEFARQISEMPGLSLEGILTHFPSSHDDPQFTREQIALFNRVCSDIERQGIRISYKHTANTGALLNHPDSHFTAVRPGLALYGYGTDSSQSFKPLLSLRSRVGLVKRLRRGETVGYGRTYRTRKEMLGAAVTIGYADGLSRALSNRGEVLVRGKRCRILGRISMDHTMIDVTDLAREKGVELADEVVVYGEQGGGRIAIEEVAARLHTVTYEVLCSIGRRVPRVYLPGAPA